MIYKITYDIMRCYFISCAVTLLIFFFYEQALFSQESARAMVCSIFIFLLILFAAYVMMFDRSRYKKSISLQCTVPPVESAMQINSDVAAYNRTISSFHEAGHAVMSYLKSFEQYDAFVTDTSPCVVSICKLQDAAGVRDYIVMLYAGAAAEEIFFGSFHSGVACGDTSDFIKALNYMKMYLMMTRSDISKACLDEEVAAHIKKLSDDLYNEALEILSQNRHMVETVASKLKETGSLTTKDIKELLESVGSKDTKI